MKATVAIEFKGIEFTGTVEYDVEQEEIESVTIDSHDQQSEDGIAKANTIKRSYLNSIKDLIEDAGLAVIEKKIGPSDALDYHDDEDQFEGYEDDMDALWNGDY